jgi:hypothetical protein
MSRPVYGVVAGLAFGTFAVLSMLRLTFPDKRAALAAAFIDRFAIGVVIGVADLSWPTWSIGLLFGLLLSAPSAIVTKSWAPIMILGGLGGVVIGVIMPHFVH